MDIWQIIWIADLVEGLSTSLFFSCIISIIASGLLLVGSFDAREPKLRTYSLWFFTVAVMSMLIQIFLPSKKVVYAYAAEKAAVKIAEDPNFKRTGEKVLKAIESKLDEVTK